MRSWARALIAITLVAAASPAVAQSTPAKQLFGAQPAPAPLEARSIGSYARGCLAGGVALPVDGSNWQVMRLSRNRNWGHPSLIAYLEKLAVAAPREGWPGLLVGDIAQPRGGPMVTGHASHQIGLDADIWLLPMPGRTLTKGEREEISAVSMLKPGTREINPATWTDERGRIIRRAASFAEVARIFVHPAIKNQLCEMKWEDRAWLRKVRPWYGHDAHFHVRLACPPGISGCANQDPPPAGEGCGEALAWWLGPAPWKPAPPRDPNAPPPPEIMMSDLPKACGEVLTAGIDEAAVNVPLPRPRPN